MRARRPVVGLGSFFGLVAVIAACGLIFSGAAQAGGVTTVVVGGVTTLSSITLNGVSGNTLTVAPGADVQIAANWADNNTDCPSCLDYVDVAYAGSANAAGCIESPGWDDGGFTNGSGTVDLGDAPTSPGTYYIIGELQEQLSCGAGYSSTDPGLNDIGEITVASPPTATLTTPPLATATYTYGQVVDANYSCGAGGIGTLSSCVGTVPNGTPISTSTVGSGEAFSVTATESDGQLFTVTHTYNVKAAATSLTAWPQLVELEPFVGVGSQTVEATLTHGGSPYSGQTVYFTEGSIALCHATTNAAGVARCTISANDQALLYRTNYYTATFAGTADYAGSTSTTLVVTVIL